MDNNKFKFFLSLSDLRNFKSPETDEMTENYAILTMSNSDVYCIREDHYKDLMKRLIKKQRKWED